ncbi:MAG TPA: isoprenylcysteine carboxylmethyltransferase family protein [Bacteroidota bacterium]
MKLSEHFRRAGAFLFRRRSYLPLLLLPLFLLTFITPKGPLVPFFPGLYWEVACFAVSLLGLGIRILTVGAVAPKTSGRNVAGQEAEALNTTGLYSIVRNPLYLGNTVMVLGAALLPGAWFLPVIVTLVLILYYERIIATEEEYLEEKFGDDFRAWAARVPAVIPRFNNFQPSEYPFSWKVALRREFYGLYAIIAAFFFLDLAEKAIAYRTVELDTFWTVLFIVGSVFFLTMRTLKKKSDLLMVRER